LLSKDNHIMILVTIGPSVLSWS